ncbi:M16 family metallopeptidase [Pseudomonas asiatica]|uniref:M16 family metallopeptidase n=1 Tax=Pseudomonas asiatica TaxID=2219225 RepID=UPI00383AB147
MTSPPTSPPDLGQVSAGLDALSCTTTSPLQHFTLENGLSVYLRENHKTSLAAVQLWYHIGSSHEPAGHTSLSHVLEHLIFAGSSKLPTDQYSRVIARIGGSANATTHLDATSYEISLPASRLPIALEIMADAMSTATFGQAEMEREIKAVEDERRLKLDVQPDQQAYDQHNALAHGTSPYAGPSFGYPADLDSIDLAALRTWYRSWYQPNNATLVVVGSVDLPTLRQHVERYFAGVPKTPVADRPVPHHDTQLQARSHTVSLPGLREGLFMSFNVPGRATAPDARTSLALTLLCDLLGAGFSSRLYSDLVRDRRLLTGVRVTYEPLVRGDTLLTISAYVNTTHATPEDAAQAVYEHVQALRSVALPEEELQRAKLRMLARRLFDLDALTSQADELGAAAAAGLPASVIDEDCPLIRDLDSATVQQVAVAYLGRERLTTTYLRPGVPA